MKNLLTDDGQIVCLIKPQFEAGREKVGKHGVVRDKAVHIEVIEMVINYAISLDLRYLTLNSRQLRVRKEYYHSSFYMFL